ncbi:Isoleucyl-tRNA synthetase, partial [mine drainage metagenome]
SFTAEEIWRHLPGARGESVLFETWYAGLEGASMEATDAAFWAELRALREELAKWLEQMRRDGEIGASLDVVVDLYVDAERAQRLNAFGEELRFFFITSEFNVHPMEQAPSDLLLTAVVLPTGRFQFRFAMRPSTAPKCVRCWHHRSDAGTHAQHPELCGRCIDNVEGPGEDRR